MKKTTHLEVPRWKIVLTVFAADLLYLIVIEWLIRTFPSLIVAIVPLYLVVPMILSIFALAFGGFISLRNGGNRTISLVLVCIILPEFVFAAEYSAAVFACYYSWPVRCY